MPLTMKPEAGKCVPRVVCDHCGQEIQRSQEGNVQWRASAFQDGGTGELYYTHKECSRAFEAWEPGTMWMWMPLASLLVHLANSLEIDWDEATERAIFLSQC